MTKKLADVPSLAGLYARAAAGSAKKRPSSTALATPALSVDGVAVTRDRDEAFRRAAGAPSADFAFFGHVHSLVMPLQMELMAADDFPLPMMGLVHLENDYRQMTPVPVDSTVDLVVRVRAFRAHRAGTEVLLDSEVRAAGSDEVLVEETSVYLAKGVRLEVTGDGEDGVAGSAGSDSTEGLPVLPAVDAPRRAFRVPVPTAHWRLGGGTGRAWAKVSGDWNPIHITGATAKALGMPGAIAHGMYTASRALAETGVHPDAAYAFSITFGAPVTLPASTPVAITRSGEPGGFDIVAWDKRKRRPHFTGTVRPL